MILTDNKAFFQATIHICKNQQLSKVNVNGQTTQHFANKRQLSITWINSTILHNNGQGTHLQNSHVITYKCWNKQRLHSHVLLITDYSWRTDPKVQITGDHTLFFWVRMQDQRFHYNLTSLYLFMQSNLLCSQQMPKIQLVKFHFGYVQNL